MLGIDLYKEVLLNGEKYNGKRYKMYDTSDDNCICGYCESERKDTE